MIFISSSSYNLIYRKHAVNCGCHFPFSHVLSFVNVHKTLKVSEKILGSWRARVSKKMLIIIEAKFKYWRLLVNLFLSPLQKKNTDVKKKIK